MDLAVKNMSEKLVELRGNRTQAAVSKDLGIAVSTLSMYESGERVPRDPIKVRIANYYGCKVQDIFFTT